MDCLTRRIVGFIEPTTIDEVYRYSALTSLSGFESDGIVQKRIALNLVAEAGLQKRNFTAVGIVYVAV